VYGTATTKVTLLASKAVNYGTFPLTFTGMLGTLCHTTTVRESEIVGGEAKCLIKLPDSGRTRRAAAGDEPTFREQLKCNSRLFRRSAAQHRGSLLAEFFHGGSFT